MKSRCKGLWLLPVDVIGGAGQLRVLASQSHELQVLVAGVFAKVALQTAYASRRQGFLLLPADDRAKLEHQRVLASWSQEFCLLPPDESAELEQ